MTTWRIERIEDVANVIRALDEAVAGAGVDAAMVRRVECADEETLSAFEQAMQREQTERLNAHALARLETPVLWWVPQGLWPRVKGGWIVLFRTATFAIPKPIEPQIVGARPRLVHPSKRTS